MICRESCFVLTDGFSVPSDMTCFMHRGYDNCFLLHSDIYCNLHIKLNIHVCFFSFFFYPRRGIFQKHSRLFICLFSLSFLRLTPSDARTVSIIMRGTWSGATPLLIVVLLGLAQGQDVPLVPGKTRDPALRSSSRLLASDGASVVRLASRDSVCPLVCGTV